MAVGLYTYGANGAPIIAGHTAFDTGNCGPDGRFSLDLGESSGGLPIPAGVRVMLVRVLHRNPDQEPASLRFTGASPEAGLALATGSNDGALAFVARSIGNNVREYLKWMKAAQALPNRFDEAPEELTETVQGDGDTQYYLGGYDLAEDEWLDVTMPVGLPAYWSLHAYNVWYEHLQVSGVHDQNAIAGPDGVIRIGVGPKVPDSVENKIDTLERRKGAFICRIIGGGQCPQAVVRKLV